MGQRTLRHSSSSGARSRIAWRGPMGRCFGLCSSLGLFSISLRGRAPLDVPVPWRARFSPLLRLQKAHSEESLCYIFLKQLPTCFFFGCFCCGTFFLWRV